MKIKIKLETPECMPEKHGDWFDLKSAEDVTFNRPFAKTLTRSRKNKEDVSTRELMFDTKMVSLGIAMQLPEGYEAHVLPRSSTAKNFGIELRNMQGIIDNTYCGDNDIWRFSAICMTPGKLGKEIHKGDRIAQFRICLKQDATFWQKLKWLFSSGKIKFEAVDSLGNKDRGGFGHTGVN